MVFRCPQDENLLGFFRRKGLNVIPTPVPETTAADPSSKVDHPVVKDSLRLRGVSSDHDASEGSSIKSPKRRTISATSGDQPRSERDPSGGSDLGESLMGLMGLSSWTPPWSMTRVNIQQEVKEDEQGRKSHTETKPDTADARSNVKRQEERGESQAERKRSTGVMTTACEGFTLGGIGVVGDGEEPQLCVLDARTAAAAMGNQLVGKGVERGAG